MAGFNWFRRAFNQSDTPDTKPESSEQETQSKQPQPAKAEPETTSQQMSPEDYLKWAKAAYQNIQKQQQTTAEGESGAITEAATEAEAKGEAAAAAPAEEGQIPGDVEAAEEIETEETPEPADATETVEAVGPAEVAGPPGALQEETETAETPEGAVEAPAEVPLTPVEPAEQGAAAPVAAVEEVEEMETTSSPEAEGEAAPATVAVEPTPTIDQAGEGVEVPVVAVENAEAPTEAPPTEQGESPQPAAVPFWARAEEERQQRLERLQETAIVEPEPEPEPVAVATQTPVETTLPDIDLDEAFIWSAEVLAAQGRRPDDVSIEEITWLNKLRQGLNKTRLSLVNQLKAIVGQGPLNEDAIMEIEALLLQADVGVEATDKVIEALQEQMRQEVLPPDQAIAYLKSILRDMLDAPLEESHNLLFVPEKDTLNIWLMTGVNGAGKTTTIGKLAHIAKKSGYNTLIAAADTFRAAAVEQVKAWGARSDVEVIANPGKNTDPAAVVYDAIAASQSRDIELLLVDTAGRLQNKKNLMDELAKIRRIVDKKAPNAKVESLLVLDATLGQNGLRQAEVFAEAANLSGVVLTKLDGTAKGGVALAVVQQLGLPIRFIGAGEGIEDLRPFSSFEFVEALLSG
jgi:fused signal recognition particle receptor